MEIFNAPTARVCTVRRERTNTPLQALVTMNDVQFVEAARAPGASRCCEDGGRRRARLDFIDRALLAAPARTTERPSRAGESCNDDAAAVRIDAQPDAATCAARRPRRRIAKLRRTAARGRVWPRGPSLASAVLNLDEAIEQVMLTTHDGTTQSNSPRYAGAQFFARGSADGIGGAALASLWPSEGFARWPGRRGRRRIASLPHFAPKAKHVHLPVTWSAARRRSTCSTTSRRLKDWFDKDLPDSIRRASA